jgi:ABC-type nitrate/sulfonate/bicarbonate transport system substrate-binding protein
MRLGSRGIEVKWVEFTSGPPLLEAMNVGSIDFGHVGDTPPIFAQAAGAAILYVAGQPTTTGQAILVPPNSPIREHFQAKWAPVRVEKMRQLKTWSGSRFRRI